MVSPDPLTSEQLAVYRAVLVAWTDRDAPPGNLANRTTPLGAPGSTNDAECGKGLDLEPQPPTLIHQILPGDLASLGAQKYKLIDPELGAQEVRKNDPERSMRSGSSVDDAVRNGFAHGLLTLGEIRFDKSHTRAIVALSFVCGSLCGHGGTIILKKTESGWQKSGACGMWISQTTPASRCPDGKSSG
ncbi:MAG: hypothetical protein P4K78_02930 [Terracidiphilus sp.]|nr:hypothetical protein [Terracidiphilus sp.]